MDAALYVHIPFCVRKCAYCDFASEPGEGRDMARYLRVLDGELAERAAEYGALTAGSVFVGGGTPSLLPAEGIAALFESVKRRLRIAPGAEITMEANPGTLDHGKLRAMREAGVNRLSIGMQAAQDPLLRAIGRVHVHAQTVEAVRLAREAGFVNINLDMMYGLPGQTAGDMRRTLDAAIALTPTHISAYSLILEQGTPLHRAVTAGEATLPDEDEEYAMHRMVIETLLSAGYARYEISNYARPGFECAHNIVYWTRGDYLGVGCAAHSLMRGERFANASSVDEYMARPQGGERIFVDDAAAREETLMLGLRMVRGIDRAGYAARFGRDFAQEYAGELEGLVTQGFMWVGEDAVGLTERGMDMMNWVVGRLVGNG